MREVLLIFETKGCFACAYGYPAGDFDNIVVECSSNVVKIWKDKCFIDIKSYSDDIFCIFSREFLNVVDCQFGSEEEFLVVGKLNDKWDIKDIL